MMNCAFSFIQKTLLFIPRRSKHLEFIPEVNRASIKRTLGLNGFDEGHTCFVTKCTICSPAKRDPKARLYVNKTTGLYVCSYCNQSGPWEQLETALNVSKSKRSKEKSDLLNSFREQSNEVEEIQKNTKEISLDHEEFHNILKKFNLPLTIPRETFEGIRINDKGTRMYLPLEGVSNNIVGYRMLHYTGQIELIPKDSTGLLTFRPPRSKDLAILVPNLSDYLLLVHKVPYNIVCLNSINTLNQYILPSLERFKKLVLWLGSDVQAWDSTKHFAKKLGENRCFLVRPSNLLPHLKPDQDFKTIIDGSHPMYHKSITTFQTLRDDVLSELQNVDKVLGVKWKRYSKLNTILKGHRRGELTVLTGATGCGKTTFISEYSLDLAMQGVSVVQRFQKCICNPRDETPNAFGWHQYFVTWVNTLWGSFEIRNVRLAKTMLQQMAGIPLDENLHLFTKLADDFEQLPIYFMTFHGQQNIRLVMEAVEHATYVHDIAHLVIDNVQFMMGTSEDQKHIDRFWKQDLLVAAFREFATKRNCHVTLVIHPRKERADEDLTVGSIFGGAKATQEADNVLIIQDKRLTSIQGKKYLQVAKNRYSGDLGVMPLVFNRDGLSYAKKSTTNKKTEIIETVDEEEKQS